MRNLIHGADIVMSHITHFYHLSALDFVNASHLGHPAAPSVGATDMVDSRPAAIGIRDALVGSYVAALTARRQAHTMSARIAGRHPMQNAIVPGGVTTLLTGTNATPALTAFKADLEVIRTFINGTYLPDVLTVATAYGDKGATIFNNLYPGILGTWNNYFAYGTGCGNLLAYGDFDTADGATTNLLLKRGRAHHGSTDLMGHLTTNPTLATGTFDHRNIMEYVGFSHYENYNALVGLGIGNCAHPWDGETKVKYEKAAPDAGTSYSWMKAPRYLADGDELNITGGTYTAGDPIPYEVGPLARMVVTALSGNQVSVPDSAGFSGLVSPYTAGSLVTWALGAASSLVTLVPHPTLGANVLFSVLGRHAARMLECKYIADAMSVWIDEVIANASDSAYTYIKIPKTLKKGAGLVEAPRGALGHWIKIEKKRVLKYQCVVPSTWNISPRDDTDTDGTQAGPAEQIIMRAGTLGNGGSNVNNQCIDVMRLLHTFDFCSACAIHLTAPDKKLVAILHMDNDGSTRVEYPE